MCLKVRLRRRRSKKVMQLCLQHCRVSPHLHLRLERRTCASQGILEVGSWIHSYFVRIYLPEIRDFIRRDSRYLLLLNSVRGVSKRLGTVPGCEESSCKVRNSTCQELGSLASFHRSEIIHAKTMFVSVPAFPHHDAQNRALVFMQRNL